MAIIAFIFPSDPPDDAPDEAIVLVEVEALVGAVAADESILFFFFGYVARGELKGDLKDELKDVEMDAAASASVGLVFGGEGVRD